MSRSLNRLPLNQVKMPSRGPMKNRGFLLTAEMRASLGTDGEINRSCIVKYRARGAKKERQMGIGAPIRSALCLRAPQENSRRLSRTSSTHPARTQRSFVMRLAL